MPLIQSNGKQISYVTSSGDIRERLRTLIFVHGAGGSHLLWNYQRNFFEESYNVVAIDLPGHGETGSEGEDSVGAYVDHLLNLLRALPGDVFCLVGHLRVLPEILEGIQERFEETVNSMCGYAFSKKASSNMIQKGIETMLNAKPSVLHGDFVACDRFDVTGRVGTIRVPTLVVCGSDDVLTPPKYAQFLAEKIQGARLEIINGAGHMVMTEKPDEFNNTVMNFLQILGDI
jgi:pimeloyl-ACP methyl ester carboxylesterase